MTLAGNVAHRQFELARLGCPCNCLGRIGGGDADVVGRLPIDTDRCAVLSNSDRDSVGDAERRRAGDVRPWSV